MDKNHYRYLAIAAVLCFLAAYLWFLCSTRKPPSSAAGRRRRTAKAALKRMDARSHPRARFSVRREIAGSVLRKALSLDYSASSQSSLQQYRASLPVCLQQQQQSAPRSSAPHFIVSAEVHQGAQGGAMKASPWIQETHSRTQGPSRIASRPRASSWRTCSPKETTV